MEEFRRRGYQVTFMTGGGELAEEIRKTGVKTLIMPGLMAGKRNLINLCKILLELRKVIREEHVRFVYGMNTLSTLLAYFAGGRKRKQIIYLNTLVGSGRNWFHKRMPFCHTVCSENQRAMLIKEGFSGDKLYVNYPTTLDMGKFVPENYSREKMRIELNIPETALVVGAVMMNSKGSSSLWKVMNRLMEEFSSLYFVFVGSSWKFPQNRERIDSEEKKTRVCILGVRRDIPNILAGMDIFSHLLDATEYETFGMVITEAMAMGKPVVASSIGGINDIVAEGESGYLVSDDEEYYKRIKELLENTEKRQQMGRFARNLCVEKFSVQRHVDRLETLFAQLSKR